MTAEVSVLRPAAAAHAEAAPAKVNLFLHVRGRRGDGYHLLESLVVFPELGDLVEMEPARGLSLAVQGPFGDSLGTGADNLVIRAAERMAGPGRGAALTLHKNLPVASGIGGGSADAAAALRLLSRVWGVPVPDDAALALGADVPVCLAGRPSMMSGIGEVLEPAPVFPAFWILLVNPLVGVPTGAVFAGLASRDNPAGPPPPSRGFSAFRAFADWLAAQRNDLEAPAGAILPTITTIIDALTALPGARIARMSGSGATCFALFESEATASSAAAAIRREEPGWWCATARVRAGSLTP